MSVKKTIDLQMKGGGGVEGIQYLGLNQINLSDEIKPG